MSNIKPLIEEINSYCEGVNIFENFKDDYMPFLLDSSLVHKEIGCFSFLGSNPFLVLKSKGEKIELEEDGKKKSTQGDVFNTIRYLLEKYKIQTIEELPAFQGGAVGFFSYDLGRQLENLPDENLDDLGVPDCYLGFYDKGLAVDHLKKKIYIFATGLPFKGNKAYKKAKDDILELKKKISNIPFNGDEDINTSYVNGELIKHFNKEEYCRITQRAIDYIAAGDIFQVNLSQRFSIRINVTPWKLYKKLVKINPAPFSAFLGFEDYSIVSSSPERFLRISGSDLETRPIKGTRPRGKNKDEDAAFKNELLNSEKDKAELVMIVDLERNDFGKVCQIGSVKVQELFRLEEYATVYHLVSIIKGKLQDDRDVVDVIKSVFPGGSITGAPKIRAMEIIEELEPVKRGVYTGSIGYLGFNGECDLNIVIRTFIIKDEKAYFQVGGGIVVDSVPEKEYEETLHKAKALKNSLGL